MPVSRGAQAVTIVHESDVQARLEIEQLIEQNDALRAELERERAERLKLEASLKPRALMPQAHEAFKALAGELKAKTLAPVVLLNIHKDDKEAVRFAKEIAVALTKAGVQVQIKQLPLQSTIPVPRWSFMPGWAVTSLSRHSRPLILPRISNARGRARG